MYAIINTGGKQYKITKGETFKTEKINAAIDKKIEADMSFLSDDKNVEIGTPTIKNKKAVLQVVSHGRDDKITVFKYKAKKRYRKKIGHRQSYTEVKFVDVKDDKKTTTKKTATKKTTPKKSTKKSTTTQKNASTKTTTSKKGS